MATITTTSIMTNILSFGDIFQELKDDLEIDANDWHLNNFYINFEDEIQDETELNRSNTSQRQHQSQVLATSGQKISKDEPLSFHQIPNYLSASNLSFTVAFFSELRSIYNPIDFQDLQQLNILTHQLSLIHLHQRLWQRYLQSGLGQLKNRMSSSLSSQRNVNITLSYWPEFVTSLLISNGIINNTVNTDDTINQNIYINFVKTYLAQLEKKRKQCQFQFDAIKNRLPNYTDALNSKIDKFVQNEGLMAMRLHFQTRIALLEYICMDRSYQLEFLQQKPTEIQIQIAKRVCQLTLDREKAEQELTLFKFRVLYKKLPRSLDILEVSLPLSITTISDINIRERLSTDYTRVIDRAKADLMSILTRAAEAKRNDCQKNFEKETKEIWKTQRQLPAKQQLSKTMVAIIEQRQKSITECVKCIYELKGNLYIQTPTTK